MITIDIYIYISWTLIYLELMKEHSLYKFTLFQL